MSHEAMFRTINKTMENYRARITELEAALSAEKAKVARYEARLEIDHCFVLVDGELVRQEIPAAEREGFIDGVFARDATIKLQERRIEAAEAEAARLREAHQRIISHETDHPNATVKRIVAISRAALGGDHG